MSKLTMPQAISSLPRLLDNLAHILRKAEENAKSRDIAPEVFLNARLAPDMWALNKQVQTMAELCKNAPYRVAGLKAPSYEGVPESFEEAYALLERAKADIAKVSEADLEGKEGRSFTIKLSHREMDYTGMSYFQGFTIPNVHFHSTTIYNILRQNGVPLGKIDYFGAVSA